jgi:ribosome maturation factor RimP
LGGGPSATGVGVMSELIIDKVRIFLQSLLPAMDLELFDVQFRREGEGWVLRVFIDSKTGVSLDQCTNVSRELGRYLDVEDSIDHAYYLEVSSPGLERPLRSTDEFRQYCGKKAKVKVHDAIDGEKVFEGVIEEVVDDQIHLKLDDGRSIKFSFEMISKARLAI